MFMYDINRPEISEINEIHLCFQTKYNIIVNCYRITFKLNILHVFYKSRLCYFKFKFNIL